MLKNCFRVSQPLMSQIDFPLTQLPNAAQQTKNIKRSKHGNEKLQKVLDETSITM